MPRSRPRNKPKPIATPGFDGAPGFVIVKVPDPYEPGATRENLRRSELLVHWHTRRQIDDAQKAAGEWLQRLHARAQLRSPSCIDYSRPLVDGGRLQEPLTDAVMLARRELMLVATTLGMIDYPLTIRVICEGVAIEAEASRWPGERPERYVARRVRDALATLADSHGAKGKERGTIRAERMDDEPVDGA